MKEFFYAITAMKHEFYARAAAGTREKWKFRNFKARVLNTLRIHL